MKDATRASEIIGPILRAVERDLDELWDLVGRNQNSGDGSFNVRSWNRLREVTEHLRDFAERMRRK